MKVVSGTLGVETSVEASGSWRLMSRAEATTKGNKAQRAILLIGAIAAKLKDCDDDNGG